MSDATTTTTTEEVVTTDPASGFPDARGEHHSRLQPRDDQGRFSAEDIERARAEERDKVYRRLERVEGERDDMSARLQQLEADMEERRKAREEQEAVERKAADEAAAEQTQRERADMSATERLQTVEEEWQRKFHDLENQRALDQAMLEKERALSVLNERRAELIEANKEEIAPELYSYIVGDTEESLQAAVERAKETTRQIFESVQAAREQEMQQWRATPTTRATAPTMGPMEQQQSVRTYTPEEIRAMPMGQWAKIRGQVLPPGSGQNRGMFS